MSVMDIDPAAERRAQKAERRAENIRTYYGPGNQGAERRAQRAERRAENIRNRARERHARKTDTSSPAAGDIAAPIAVPSSLVQERTQTMSINEMAGTDVISALVSEIFPAPEYDEIALTDPRFGWVVRRLYAGNQNVATLRDLVDLAVADMTIDNEPLVESLRHLREFMQEQVDSTLEDELFAILAALPTVHGRVHVLLDRLGWSGTSPITLQQAADRLGVTRERVRQIQARTERHLLSHSVWTPVLDRAVKIVKSDLPISERDMGIRLKNAGIAKTATFSSAGLLKAIELFAPGVTMELVHRHGSTWIVDPNADDQALIVTDVRTAVQKAVSNQGIVHVGDVRSRLEEDIPEEIASYSTERFRRLIDDLDDYQVIEDEWIVHRDPRVRNPVVNRLQKILSVAASIPVDWAVHQLRRELRENRQLDMTPEKLAAFVRHRPEFNLRDGRISAHDPENPREALSECEFVLWHRILENGVSATFSELESVGLLAGFQKVTVAVTLKASPIFYKPGYNTYRAISDLAERDQALEPAEVDLKDDQDDIDAAIEQAHLEESHPIFDMADTSESDDVAEGEEPAAPQPPVTTAAGLTVNDREAGRVRRLIKQLLKREGMVSVDTITDLYGKQYRPVSHDVVLAVATGTGDYVVINDQLVTSMPRNGTNPLAAGLRKMLTWLPALPPEVAVRQFLRDQHTVTLLTEEMLLEYVRIDDEFGMEDSVIVWRQPDLVSNVMSTDEKAIAHLLRDLPEPIGLGTVHERLKIPRHQVPSFDEMFLNSVLVEEVGKHRYRLVGAEFREAITRQEVSEVVTSSDSGEQNAENDAAAVSAVVAARSGEESESTIRPASRDHDVRDGESIDLIDEAPVATEAPSATLARSRYGSTETTMITLHDLIASARDGRLRLPEIQREYVWKSTQVRTLLDSLYRSYPIGNMLIWQTTDTPVSRQIGSQIAQPAVAGEGVSFLLDGQQRLTSLQRLLDHNEPDIRFNPFTEEFRAATATVQRNPQWIPVHTVLTRSVGAALRDHGLDRHPDVEELERRLERLKGILSVPIPVNRLHNFDYEAVTDIFVRVNSQGTRLRTAELAVANLAFQLPGIVSSQLGGLREELAESGWDIDTMVLLRMLNAIVTGQASFGRLAKVHSSEIEESWPRLNDGVHRTMGLLRKDLGIETVEWLPTMTALIVPVAYLGNRGESQTDKKALTDWFVRASIFGRYTGQTETRLNQDLRAIGSLNEPFSHMTRTLRGTVGNFRITLAHLQGASWQSALSLLYWLTLRRAGAVDFWTGERLVTTRPEGGHELFRHQLFPRKARSAQLPVSQINELSNFALLVSEPDIMIQNAVPAQSLQDVPVDRLESQFIPTDPELWQPANARRFMEHRRRLLVRAMNETLQSLQGDDLS